MDKIHICIVIPTFKCGGSEKFISILCNHIKLSKFNVTLYILDGEDPFYKVTNPGINVISLNIKNVRKSLLPILKIMKRDQPDILFTAANHLNVFLSIFKFLMPRKVKFIARESSNVSINNKKLKYGNLYDKIVKAFYKNIDFIICQSAYMQSDLIKNYKIKKEKTIVINNPVEDVTYHIHGGPGSLLKKNAKFKFFTVGRLSPEKGIARIIRALALLEIDYEFYIIGDGTEAANLQSLTNELNLQRRVIFEGMKNNPYDSMGNSDLFLIGSYFEGFPNVLLESGMLGVPVVGYKAPGGISDIIIEGENGLLVNDDQTGIQFSTAILKALSMEFDRKSIRDRTIKNFSLNKILNQIESCFIRIHNDPA